MNPAPKLTTMKLALNVPTEIRLKYPKGLEVTGQYGPQVMFTTPFSTRLYVPPEVAKEIYALSLPNGEPFMLTKGQRDGSRSFEWKVERKHPAAPAKPPASEKRSATQLEDALKTAIAAAHEAEKYGTAIGYTVRFSEESIRCMANTVLINMGRAE